jgi:ribokinase
MNKGQAQVLVLGALHHDVVVDAPHLPRLDETLRGTGVDYRFGGKGGNQAVAAARMGASVAMMGRVGADAAGRDMLAALDAAGVARDHVLCGQGPSGMSVAITLPDGGYGAVIVSGANLENDGRMPDGQGPWVALIQNEIPAHANRSLAAALGPRDILIWNAAPAGPLETALAARCDLLLVNRVEAEDLSGQTDPEIAARHLFGQIRGDVIVTLGGAGAILCRGTGLSHHPALPVEVVSTHGAGDMFAGALAAGIARGDPLDAALRFAQIAAGLFVASPIALRARITRAAVLDHRAG